jgi:hypothetical protein
MLYWRLRKSLESSNSTRSASKSVNNASAEMAVGMDENEAELIRNGADEIA